MWYFTIKQRELSNEQHQQLRKRTNFMEIEAFSDPYPNYCLFEVDSENYLDTMNYLDLEGIVYGASTHRPQRDELLDRMQ
ncbi:MAG: hypothetical protein V4714_06755 [Bacteroidota bacterium]